MSGKGAPIPRLATLMKATSISSNARASLRTLAMLVTASISANVANAHSEVFLRLDERQIRAAGITSITIEQERAES